MTEVITLETFITVYSIIYRYCFELQTGISHITTAGKQRKITREITSVVNHVPVLFL